MPILQGCPQGCPPDIVDGVPWGAPKLSQGCPQGSGASLGPPQVCLWVGVAVITSGLHCLIVRQLARLKAKGADCFHQRLEIVRVDVGKNVSRFPVPCSPKALQRGTAKNILSTLVFPWLIDHWAASLKKRSKCSPALVRRVVMFLVLAVCVDAHASNTLTFNYLVSYYKRFNRFGTGMITFLALVYCAAHQVHLCSKTVIATLGGDCVEQNKVYVAGLIGMSHIFSQSSYFIRIFAAAVNIIGTTQVLTQQEARERGIEMADEQCTADKKSLMRWLMKWVLGTRTLPRRIEEAICIICEYWNSSLQTWLKEDPYHVHTDECKCGGSRKATQRLLSAFTVVYNRLLGCFSEGRWTSSMPSQSMVGMWLFPHQIGTRASFREDPHVPLIHTHGQVFPNSVSLYGDLNCFKRENAHRGGP